MTDPSPTGDSFPGDCEVIEVRVAELRHLFNAIDPSPFRERDLDPKVEEFIVDWSREAPNDAPLALLVRLDRSTGQPDEATLLRDAVHEFFAQRAVASRRRLHRLFRVGRTSLGIGLAVLVLFTAVAQLVVPRTSGSGFAPILRESLSIGGWVAMWRPLEIFLYDWWPIRADAKLFDRLAAMPVRISHSSGPPPEIPHRDSPTPPPDGATAR
jgi:hypothetical protein